MNYDDDDLKDHQYYLYLWSEMARFRSSDAARHRLMQIGQNAFVTSLPLPKPEQLSSWAKSWPLLCTCICISCEDCNCVIVWLQTSHACVKANEINVQHAGRAQARLQIGRYIETHFYASRVIIGRSFSWQPHTQADVVPTLAHGWQLSSRNLCQHRADVGKRACQRRIEHLHDAVPMSRRRWPRRLAADG